MNTTADMLPRAAEDASTTPVAPDVSYLQAVFVNVYFVGAPGGPWALVDTGLPGCASWIRRAAEQRFGPGARPEAIVLTHGHFDHAGSAQSLADAWDVPIYAHRLELPYLTGHSDYPPQDPTVGGTLALLSRVFPHGGYDFGPRVRALPDDGRVPGMPGWRWLHTPGHTAGHASLFRDADRLLLAGDALATVNQESALTLLTLPPELRWPPAPFTTDWGAARYSVEALAELRPVTLGAGHGQPVTGDDVADRLRHFAAQFPRPSYGRYIHQPARADERGVVSVPPPVADPLRSVALAALAGVALAVGLRALAARGDAKRG